MRYKLISCDVFMRSLCQRIATTPNIIDPEFTRLGSHENSNNLRSIIQGKIDNTEGQEYDAILLAYGLCGNSTMGLVARSIPLIIPRAHDCCTILLGSRERFLECFGSNLSSQWSSIGYLERSNSYLRGTDTGKLLGSDKEYDEYVALYGEENALYIWESLHPQDENDEIVYIETPGLEALGHLEQFKQQAFENGKELRVLQGDTRLLHGLLQGKWDHDDFLVVPQGKTIKAIYDQDIVFDI